MASGCRRLAVGGAPIGPLRRRNPAIRRSYTCSRQLPGARPRPRTARRAATGRYPPQTGRGAQRRWSAAQSPAARGGAARTRTCIQILGQFSGTFDPLRPSMNDPPAAERPRQDNSREPFLAKPFGAPLLRAVRDGRQPRASARSCPQLSTWPSSGAAVWNASMPLTTTWRGTWDPNDRPQDGDAPEGGTSHAA